MAGLLNSCLTDVKLDCSGRGRGVALHTKQRKFAFHLLKLDHPLPSPHVDRVNIDNVVSIIPIFLCHCIQNQSDNFFEVFYNFSLFYCTCASSKSFTLSWPIKQETTWSTMRKNAVPWLSLINQASILINQGLVSLWPLRWQLFQSGAWRDSDKTVDNKCVNWTLHTFRGKLLPVYPHCPKYPLAGAIVIIKGVLRQLAEWSWEWNNGTE